MSKIRSIIYPIAMLTGTIVGVGFFSLPYITLKVGVWVMLGYFAVLGFISVLIHTFFGEVALKTPDFSRFPGFVRFHLGSWAGKLSFISTILGTFGALLAYLIVGGSFLAALLKPLLGGSEIIYVLLYFTAAAILIFLGVKIISKVEFWGLFLFFLILIVFYFKGFSHVKIDNFLLVGQTGIANLFLPYGAVLFSLSGASLIPEVEEMLGERKHLLKKVVAISILIAILIYLSFIFLVLGISGPQTTESSLTGLRDFLGRGAFALGLFFGVLTTFTSLVGLGLNLKNVFHYDLKLGRISAWAITCFVPLSLFLSGIKNFISIISLVGGILLGFDGILILLMYKKVSRKNLLIYPLISVFLAGIIYEVVYFTK